MADAVDAPKKISLLMQSKDGCARCDALLDALAAAGAPVTVAVVKLPTKEARQALLDSAGMRLFPVVFDVSGGSGEEALLVGGPLETAKYLAAKGVEVEL